MKNYHHNVGLDGTKPVLSVSNKMRKSISSATETSKKIEISPEASFDIVLSKKRITKVLISLCVCAGWSMPLLYANPKTGFLAPRPM